MAEQSGAVVRPRNLARYFAYLLRAVPGARTVLDVGGGMGALSFFSALWFEAEEVVCLEPGAAGSNDKMLDAFSALQASAGTGDRVRLEPAALEDYEPPRPFDLVLMHNSINHLDEESVSELHRSAEARSAYLRHLERIAALTAPGGTLVIADASPDNLFARLGVHNPFAPTIEWHIHQPPDLWAQLLSDVGFAGPKIRWTGINRLGPLTVLTRNKPVTWCLNSHFALTMRRPAEEAAPHSD